jgi:hypothetical protein
MLAPLLSQDYFDGLKQLGHRLRGTALSLPWSPWLMIVQLLALFLLAIWLVFASIALFPW